MFKDCSGYFGSLHCTCTGNVIRDVHLLQACFMTDSKAVLPPSEHWMG
jgi:hypothetical protein